MSPNDRFTPPPTPSEYLPHTPVTVPTVFIVSRRLLGRKKAALPDAGLQAYARLSTTAQHPFRRSLPHARAQTHRAGGRRALLPLCGTEPHHPPALGARLRPPLRRVQVGALKRSSRARLHPRLETSAP